MHTRFLKFLCYILFTNHTGICTPQTVITLSDNLLPGKTSCLRVQADKDCNQFQIFFFISVFAHLTNRYCSAEVYPPNQTGQTGLRLATQLLQVSTLTSIGEDNQNLILFETAYILICFSTQYWGRVGAFYVLVPTEVMNISIQPTFSILPIKKFL